MNATATNAAVRTASFTLGYMGRDFPAAVGNQRRPLETGDALCDPDWKTETLLALGVGAYEVSCRARTTKCSRRRRRRSPRFRFRGNKSGPPLIRHEPDHLADNKELIAA